MIIYSLFKNASLWTSGSCSRGAALLPAQAGDSLALQSSGTSEHLQVHTRKGADLHQFRTYLERRDSQGCLGQHLSESCHTA